MTAQRAPHPNAYRYTVEDEQYTLGEIAERVARMRGGLAATLTPDQLRYRLNCGAKTWGALSRHPRDKTAVVVTDSMLEAKQSAKRIHAKLNEHPVELFVWRCGPSKPRLWHRTKWAPGYESAGTFTSSISLRDFTEALFAVAFAPFRA